MDENVGKVPALHGERTGVDERSAFVEDHVARLHSDVDSFSLPVDDFQGPRFVDVLCDVDDAARNEREAVDVRRQDGSLRVDTDSVLRDRFLFHSCPSLDGGLDGVPDLALQSETGTAPESRILDAHHVRRRVPVWYHKSQCIRRKRSAQLLEF